MSLKLPTRKKRLGRLLVVVAALTAYVAGAAALSTRMGLPERIDGKRCTTLDGWLYCSGQKFLVKAVGWDPTRPGKLPWDGERSAALVDLDFQGIRAAGFNTIRTWEALTPDELAAAEKHDLAVLQGIWVEPTGDFSDSVFRREQLAKVKHVARYSHESPAILAYLVMNEPAPDHLLQIGLDTSKNFLLEIAATIRREDPGALVSFSSWPGLEFFDVPDLDFVAVNLHPFRPRVLIDAIGYDGMVRLWKTLLAGERPLLITEYGISVAPKEAVDNEPGGATEAQQARDLPRLAEAIVRSGGAGSATFMWIDGWWKNADGAGDEHTHDPEDGEEWFGLRSMERIGDKEGRARPALSSMRRWNRAVLTSPADWDVASAATKRVEIEIYLEQDLLELSLRASLDGDTPVVVPIVQNGNWIRGELNFSSPPTRLGLELFSKGKRIADWQRRLYSDLEGLTLDLSVIAGDQGPIAVALLRDKSGRGVAGVPIRLAFTDASSRFDRLTVVTTDEIGEVRIAIELPPAPAHLLVVAALRDGDDEPPVAMAAKVVGGNPTR